MHEMSIAMAVVEQIERAEPSGTVESVRLQIGELAGVVPEALRFSFGLICEGTVLEGAELHIDAVPGRARCAPCATEWDTGMPPRLGCPSCGGTSAELVSGRELRIRGVRWHEPAAVAAHSTEES